MPTYRFFVPGTAKWPSVAYLQIGTDDSDPKLIHHNGHQQAAPGYTVGWIEPRVHAGYWVEVKSPPILKGERR